MNSSSQITSREIVRRCIEFDNPPRIAFSFKTNPVGGKVWDETDFVFVSYLTDPQYLPPKDGPCEWTMEWGNRRQRFNNGIGESISFPLSEGWHQLAAYRFPDFSLPRRYAHLPAEVAREHADGKYVVGGIPPQMTQLIELRGMENWFLDNILEKDNLAKVLENIVDIQNTIIEYYSAAGADAVIMWDDMGSGNQAFVSPECFREIYFPYYKRLLDSSHKHGMHFIHHCCGQVWEYMNMFVEAGCDVIQLDQPELMGIERLGKTYGGKICFWNSIDIQKTIGSGNLDDIDTEARRQILSFGNFNGGFMFKAYGQPEAIGMTPAQMERQKRAFKRLGKYPLKEQ